MYRTPICRSRPCKLISLLVTLCCICVVARPSEAEITYIPVATGINRYWDSDSLFYGAGFVSASAWSPITVSWQRNMADALAELSFMSPARRDSAVFIFHNYIDRYPNETAVVSLGCFPAGTPLVFRCVLTDTAKVFRSEGICDKKLYSGQNRPGIDEYISERADHLGTLRWAVAGRVDSAECEMGFSVEDPGSNRAIRFHITNVLMEGVDSLRLPKPRLSKGPKLPDGTLNLDLDAGTAMPIQIKYTTDGSDPKSAASAKVHSAPIHLTGPMVLKAYSVGDSAWHASDVLTEVLSLETSTFPAVLRSRLVSGAPSLRLVDGLGRLVPTATRLRPPGGAGCVVAKAEGKGGAFVVVLSKR